MPNALDLTGRRFGRLVALERAGSAPDRKALWRCRCDCGNEKTVRTTYLTSGDTRSCGCLHLEGAVAKGRRRKADLAGRTFGRLRVLAEAGRTAKGEARWDCVCSCGRKTTVTGSRLTGGFNLSCGCLRDELLRARAAAVGGRKTVRACRTCARIYEATGPQKECSDACRRQWHAADEARRREENHATLAATEMAALNTELERRLTDGPK